MRKVEIYDSIEAMNEARVREEMNMTPVQRIELVFQLMDLAIAMSPNKKLESYKDDDIPWIELKLKNDFT